MAVQGIRRFSNDKLPDVRSGFHLPLDTPFSEIVVVAQSWFREWSKKPMAVQKLPEIVYYQINLETFSDFTK